MTIENRNVEPDTLRLFDVIEYTLSDDKTRRAVVVQPEGEGELGVCEIIALPEGGVRLGFAGALPDGQRMRIVGIWTQEKVEEAVMNTIYDSSTAPFEVDKEIKLRSSVRKELGRMAAEQSTAA